MKVFLDENLPHPLRHALSGHDSRTAAYMGWLGVRNGQLLALAEAEGFEVFLTADRNLEYQQNFAGRRIALVVLTAQKWEIVAEYVEEITHALKTAMPGTYQRVQCDPGDRSTRD